MPGPDSFSEKVRPALGQSGDPPTIEGMRLRSNFCSRIGSHWTKPAFTARLCSNGTCHCRLTLVCNWVQLEDYFHRGSRAMQGDAARLNRDVSFPYSLRGTNTRHLSSLNLKSIRLMEVQGFIVKLAGVELTSVPNGDKRCIVEPTRWPAICPLRNFSFVSQAIANWTTTR